MIVTLTPNPSIDRTVSITSLEHGEVHRATASRIDPGGKGINVSRALAAHGLDTVAVLPAGGPEGHLMEELLDAANIARLSVPIAGSVRMNVALVEPDGTTTKINEPGPTMSGPEIGALLDGVADALKDSPDWLVGCGSLPPGMPATFYADLVARGHDSGVKVCIDSSGSSMQHAVGAGPDLIKPNQEELEEIVGRPLSTLQQVHDAATELVKGGVGTVLVSLGSHGALLVHPAVTAHGKATVAKPLSTVGAGDSLLAGYLHATATGASPGEALAAGIAWGAAAVSLPGSVMPTPQDVKGVVVDLTTAPDLTQAVAD
ncbi:MAG TPA: 1-phosphofructokinase [Dermatophilaceae bacterium]|nr:1-phosphofructokinase [Dermatophilaceae bacterium]